MHTSFTAGVRDSLSNLAASLNAGRDKAANDSFVLYDIDRLQIEAMYRGDWLARKVVDIVPYDAVREWRTWSGHREDVARMEAAERRLGLRQAVQRAMTLGRLYGGGAIVIGTGESDPAALAQPLDPEALPRGGLRFLHAISRWQLAAPAVERDPLSPWFGEATAYEVVAPARGALQLHPSRVVRFLGNPWPDPTVGAGVWSDSVLLALYDAVHAVALTTAGATSLMHEAKVDVVTVPNLSEHLSSADTTAQLSARFGYAAAMKSINNLLLLGDGETWARQRIDFAGLPEMVRTFLQMAAGAADIPVTRLLGQSPAGLSATGDSDTRNYYDMIAARQEIDLRPKLERLDRLIAASEGIDAGALTFAFRPLWQLDATAQAALALQKAQATQIYAGLGLWPAATTARLVEAQLAADGVYPNAGAVFAEGMGPPSSATAREAVSDYVGQPRDPLGQFAEGRESASRSIIRVTEPEDPESDRVKPLAPFRLEVGPAGKIHLPEFWAADPPASPGASPQRDPQAAHPSQPESLRQLSELPAGVTVQEAKELHIKRSPAGVSFDVSGNSTTAVGSSYSDAVNTFTGADPVPPTAEAGSSRPDGLLTVDGDDSEVAIEAKYIQDWSHSIYNPDLDRSFPHTAIQDVIEQARRYAIDYPLGVMWFTNSLDFARTYARKFNEAGIENYSFTIIPAVRIQR